MQALSSTAIPAPTKPSTAFPTPAKPSASLATSPKSRPRATEGWLGKTSTNHLHPHAYDILVHL